MALGIPDILSALYPGNTWGMAGDDYATLDWSPANVLAKPTEIEIRSREAEAVAFYAAQAKRERMMGRLYDADELLKALEILAAGLVEIGGKLKPAALSSPLDTAIASAVVTLKNKLADFRSTV